MGKGTAKKTLKRTAIIVGSIALVFVVSSLVLMILDNYVFTSITVDIFSTAVSGSHDMNVPFSIIIDIFSSTAGILLGLRIDRYSSEQNEEEEVDKMWAAIAKLVGKLSADSEKQTLFVLSNYKIHWDALLRSDSLSVRTLQNDEKYFALSDIFYYLDFHRNFWEQMADKKCSEIIDNVIVNIVFRDGLKEWQCKINEMNSYLEARHGIQP